jgi:hypothetical protein
MCQTAGEWEEFLADKDITALLLSLNGRENLGYFIERLSLAAGTPGLLRKVRELYAQGLILLRPGE